MLVRINVESRDNTKTYLFWSPSPPSLVKSSHIYTSLTRDGVYTKRRSNLLNKSDETGTAPKVIKGFYKQGSMTFTLDSSTTGISADKEYYVKVTEVYIDNTEELIGVAPPRYVRLPGRATTILRNINRETEKGLLIWDEEDNSHKRAGGSLLLDQVDEKYALDVKVLESVIDIKNETDTDSNIVPVIISRTIDPVVIRKSQVVSQGATVDIFNSEDFTPDSTKKYCIRDIKISSSDDIKYSLQYNGEVLDLGYIIAQDGVHSVFSGEYEFVGAQSGGDLILEITPGAGDADVFALLILERKNQ